MDYEKLHKDTINKLQQMVNSGKITVETARGICADFVPESKDERIRKEIIAHIKWCEDSGYCAKEEMTRWIAFLEKQGEQKPYGQRQECVDCQFNYAGECKGSCAIKRGEQKPTDTVEPKFKVGDWITNGDYTWKIVEVKPLDYILQSQDGNIVDDTISHVDEQFHSFTIKDAKDGDVLYSLDSKQPFIFKHRKPHEQAKVYCGINIYGKFFVGNTKDCIITTDKYIPATKDQRDTLERAMTGAGYTFNFEKKELKEVEQKPADTENGAKGNDREIPNSVWSEEDEARFGYCIKVLQTSDGYDTINAKWLKSLKERYTWKPSDEQMIALQEAMNIVGILTITGSKINSLYQDLKKLREK